MLILDSQTLQIIKFYNSYLNIYFINSARSSIAYIQDQKVWFMFRSRSGFYLIQFNDSYDIEKSILLSSTTIIDSSLYGQGHSISIFKNGRVYNSYVWTLSFDFIPYAQITTFSIPSLDVDPPWFYNTYTPIELDDVRKCSNH